MKQEIIIETSNTVFQRRVQERLDEGWMYIPDTLKVVSNNDSITFTVMLFSEEPCQCPECVAEAHHSHMPPPFFQSPDEEPQPPECNPGASGN